MRARLRRLLATRSRKIAAAALVVAVIAVAALALRPAAAPATSSISTEDVRITAPGGAGASGPVSLDATVYLPKALPAPAVIMAHGFGGSKQSIAGDARDLATHGFVVLAYSARGFGQSTGQIALDSLDYEIPDARAIVDWLAKRTDVVQDGPGDPRVGVTGASYGGALSLMLAGTDPRVDADVPLITWNDLAVALFPNAVVPSGAGPVAETPAAATSSTDGVLKKAWTATLMSSVISGSALSGGTGTAAPADTGDSGFTRGQGGSTSAPAAPTGSGPGAANGGAASGAVGCGRMMLNLCAGYSEAAQSGRLPPALASLLARSSPKAVVGKIKAPTLLVQGERDTLFGLDQADANARAIAANGASVALTWYNGGHDGGTPDQVTRDRISGWFTSYLGRGAAPARSFNYSVDGPLSDTGRARTRTLQVAGYPGIDGTPAVSSVAVPLAGGPQTVLNPPGGAPAGISSLPGLSGLAGNVLSSLGGGLPGQVARFRSEPLGALTVIAGTPRISVSVSAAPSTSAAGTPPAGSGAVLFVSMSKVTEGGVRTLAGNAVAPIRISNLPTSGSPVSLAVDLPAVAFQVEAGSRLEVDVATTDQAYAGSDSPAVYRVALAGPDGSPGQSGNLTLPIAGGLRVSAGELPVGTLIGLIALAAVAVLALVLGGRVRRPRAVPTSQEPVAETIAGGPGSPPAPNAGPGQGQNSAHRPAVTGTGPPPLEIIGLGKLYPGGVAAVTDVSFRVEKGQVLGLLGPNGAGKTTTLRMVMGLITPTAGQIRVFGQLVRPGADILARIGSFVEGSGFLPHLSGKANLNLYWRATGRPAADAHLPEALEIAGLGNAINRRVKTYSQGMRQRLAIAQSMLGLPDLLLLDEPTNGLDPPQIHAMREVLRGYAATGRTVLISSHMLSEVEQTCSHVVVVHQGRTIAAGTVADLVAASGDMVFTVDPVQKAAQVLRGLPGIGRIDIEPQELGGGAAETVGILQLDLGSTPASTAIAALVEAGVQVNSAAPRNRLEDVFLELVGAAGTDSTGAIR